MLSATTPWCGHCKTAKPKFSEAAKEVHGKVKDVIFANLNCESDENYKKAQKDYGLKSYPSFYWNENGEFKSPYNGIREAKDFTDYALTFSHPELVNPYMNECDALGREIEKRMSQAVGVYFGKLDGPLYNQFKLLDDPVGGMAFIPNVNPECAEHIGVTQPGIAMFVGYDFKPIVYTGKADAQSIVDFMEPLLYPGINELHSSDYDKLRETELN